jgi:hypothetical protein
MYFISSISFTNLLNIHIDNQIYKIQLIFLYNIYLAIEELIKVHFILSWNQTPVNIY